MKKMFKAVDPRQDFIKMEHKILRFWSKNKIFKKFQCKNKNSKRSWSFLDGPITANNPMGVHHAWGRTLKDVFQRFKNMQGYQERFQNGFDCQGLWVEVEVEKELGFKNKKDIEEYGVDKFVEKCKERVKKFSAIQTKQSIRLGQFMDWDNSYYTMSEENNYAIWHFLKQCHQKKYLYKGRDSVPWCARCGTAISQHEILTEEYKEIVHTAVYFKLPIISAGFDNTYLLVWTTTPWTIPANVAVAMSPEFDYGIYQNNKTQEKFIVLKKLAEKIFKKDYQNFKLIKELKGKELSGLKYQAAFDDLDLVIAARQENPDTFHTVIMAEDLVTEAEGTGMVHIAPGCGKEDFDLSKEQRLSVIAVIDEEAKYLKRMGELSGKNAKENPKLIFNYLKENAGGRFLYKLEDYKHRYPTCWRCKEELVWRVVDEWYISMDELRQPMMEVTKKINWMPSFGKDQELDWLKNMHDWLISKKRYWGLALPIYECKKCGHFEVMGSREELKKRAVAGWDDFDGHTPHKPWIDQVKIKCANCGTAVSRIPDVGNPWLDAGIVPYSTMGYFRDKIVDVDGKEKTGKKYWQKWFPADLILECFPGQFKNWFYSLIAMSTVLENTNPFKAVLGHSLVRDEKGEEMHKSKGNAIWFDDAAEKMGVDVMRYMYASAHPYKNLNFGYGPADAYRRRIILLWNVYSFFITYANIDKFDPTKSKIDFSKLNNKLDRYIISLLHETIKNFTEIIGSYDVFTAMNYVEEFLESLANWYVRRSRRRFWKSKNDEDKLQAYHTLYEVLIIFIRMLAPIMPFLTEEMYQNLGRLSKNDLESIHLCDYPKYENALIDHKLNDQMRSVLKISSLAHAARDKAQIKVRQPLNKLFVFGITELDKNLKNILLAEVNVKAVELIAKKGQAEEYADSEIKLNFKILGEKYREEVKSMQKLLRAEKFKLKEGILNLGKFELGVDEFEIEYKAKGNYSVESDKYFIVVLDTNITAKLKQEGLARDLVRYIQDLRKEANFQVDDRIVINYELLDSNDDIEAAILNFGDYIGKETLAESLNNIKSADNDIEKKISINSSRIIIGLKKS